MLQSLLDALSFLTLFPSGKSPRKTVVGMTKERVAASTAFFPLVGLLLGAIALALSQSLTYLGAPQMVGAFLAVAALALLSRGLHLDGLADCFDALHYAGGDKLKALEVLRDARLGAFGASALALVLAGKLAALSSTPQALLPFALLAVPALARWTPAVVARLGAPAAPTGLGYTFIVYTKKPACLASALLALAIAVGFALGLIPSEERFPILLGSAALFLALSIAAALLTRYFMGTLGGVTGDVFGAAIELSELLGFIAVPLLFR